MVNIMRGSFICSVLNNIDQMQPRYINLIITQNIVTDHFKRYTGVPHTMVSMKSMVNPQVKISK